MRVIGGLFKGRKLISFKGKDIRPTSDRVKESLFNIISADLESGIRVADLYSGTGNLGIEAISHGAAEVVFVENDKNSIAILKKNLTLCGIEEKGEIIPLDVKKAIPLMEQKGEAFDIIFLDPPYKLGLADETLELLGGSSLLSDAIVIAEYSKGEEIKERYGSLEMKDSRKYGNTIISFFAR